MRSTAPATAAVATPLSAHATADSRNVALFGSLAADWWDPQGSSRLLHRINPPRLAFIRDAAVARFGCADAPRHRPLAGLSALDVGCGGGLVAEPLARMGAAVVGLDAGAEVIAVARAHAAAQGLAIDYRVGEVTGLAAERPAAFDLVTCLEVIEHVADRAAFLAALAALLRPGGLLVFSTPNRTIAARVGLIWGAERIARLIPDGGHDWHRFVTPAELTAMMAAAGLSVRMIRGLGWSPWRGFHIGDDTAIDYIGTATA